MGDRPRSFEEFFEEHYDATLRALTVAFRDPPRAETAVRDAFARAYMRHLHDGRGEHDARWLLITSSRSAVRHQRGDLGAPVSDPDTVERAIEELPERERVALVLHHHGGLRSAELGRALRCSPAIAAGALREAHRMLGIEPDDDDDIPEVDLDAP